VRLSEIMTAGVVTATPATSTLDVARLMRDHRVGIVTLDDIAVRTGNLELAQKMTQDVIEGALPQFYFHERG
jgi:CBS domain-containing protein